MEIMNLKAQCTQSNPHFDVSNPYVDMSNPDVNISNPLMST